MARTHSPYRHSLGTLLRERRKRAGISQSDVADAIQVTPASVSAWELGERAPGPAHLAGLLRLFNISDADYVDCVRREVAV